MARLSDWQVDWFWLEDFWSLARMTGEDLGSRIALIDMPESSGNQCRLGDSQCLEDGSTLNPHCHLGLEVEWGWLNPCSEAIDMAFIDPAFADWALL